MPHNSQIVSSQAKLFLSKDRSRAPERVEESPLEVAFKNLVQKDPATYLVRPVAKQPVDIVRLQLKALPNHGIDLPNESVITRVLMLSHFFQALGAQLCYRVTEHPWIQ
jgi:hypothetical protein